MAAGELLCYVGNPDQEARRSLNGLAPSLPTNMPAWWVRGQPRSRHHTISPWRSRALKSCFVFFWCGLFFKSLHWICYNVISVLCFLVFWLWGMRDLSFWWIEPEHPALEGKSKTPGLQGSPYTLDFKWLIIWQILHHLWVSLQMSTSLYTDSKSASPALPTPTKVTLLHHLVYFFHSPYHLGKECNSHSYLCVVRLSLTECKRHDWGALVYQHVFSPRTVQCQFRFSEKYFFSEPLLWPRYDSGSWKDVFSVSLV